MNFLDKIIYDIEIHSEEGIKNCFENGISPNDFYKGKPLINELITEYLRGPGFKACFRIFLDYGLVFEDKVLQAVFLDDADSLNNLLNDDQQLLEKRYSFPCAFTPLKDASLLHICAEYNHFDCAKILIKHGIDINIKAGTDENGFGSQTPVFHTVNQGAKDYVKIMKLLVSEGADLSYTVKGFLWGKGYEWETFIAAVNPLSYAMMGLLPQFQRKQENVYEIINILIKSAYGIDYKPENIPNRYLQR